MPGLKAGHLLSFGSGGADMSNGRIERVDKNRMRFNLEEMIQRHKEIEQRVDQLLAEETVENYRHFWQELKKQCYGNQRDIYQYMVRKCNR
jgi:TolA-binding protein